jgi:hypothetical protein
VDLLAIEADALARASSADPAVAGRILDLQEDLVREALMDDRFDLLDGVASKVPAATERDSGVEPGSWLAGVLAERAVLQGDREARARGRYRCFVQGNWDEGLPLLEKDAAVSLKWTAQRDLKGTTAGGESLEIGDAWRDLAGQEKTRVGRALLNARALRWYQWAKVQGPRDVSEAAEERLKKVGPVPPPLDLLRRIVPADHVLTGTWAREGSALVDHAGDSFDKLEIPYEPAEEFDLVLEVRRVFGPHAFVVGLATPKAQVTVTFDGWDGSTSGIDLLDRASGNANESSVKGRVWIPGGGPTRILCQVRRGALRVEVNGERMIDWQGNFDRFSMHPNVAIRNTRGLFLGSWKGGTEKQTDFAITRIEVIPVSGPGRFVR